LHAAPVLVNGLPAHSGADVVAIAAGYQHSLVAINLTSHSSLCRPVASFVMVEL
jgi:hypothetical protein